MSKVFTITEGLENMGALRTGGQGSVYKGRRYGPIITAVKLLPTPIHTESTDDKNFRNFQNEVEKLKKVNEEPNPNVVKILNSGITESGSFPFIEMEFIDGPDLEDLLKPPHEPIFTIKEIIKLADQLANALSHCHKVSVKHGDIKSNNVKFNIHTGNYVLLDFGLSAMSDDQRRTSIRHAGAIEFMAPEQNEGLMYFQTDVYSYGVILYELIAGQVPFPLRDNGETSRNAVMLAHMESPVPDVMELRKNNLPESWTEKKKEHEMLVPAWLLQIVAKCLKKDPDDRFADGIELQETLMHSSISAVSNNQGDDTWNSSVLLKENERLQGLLLYYQEAENNKAVQPVITEGAAKPVDDGKQVRMSKPIFILFMFMLCGFTVFSAVVLSKYGDKIYHGVYSRLFKSSKKPVDSTKNVILPQKKEPEKQQDTTTPANDESGIPPEVDSQADSILKGMKYKKSGKEEPQFYRDSAKTKDTSNLNF
ncbi:serine/threonine protein kinase [Mucilaginibacter lappiensis]|uniref:Serine/threonine protein kinase n=1 Tax=Mucilaginibacter lappiensis TaxID=354630 RepID=A0A1N6V7P1_9SPHI|nr:serine/threonine-protein kinase [Mucilaginibacter lappiensis]MBB6109057.1 serine/threonine protein kinase [Mucilaginibacter lappiensis]MBB6127348.1 serine/threonine protein kinase [Mucilaginibacter lappiensis]SIQ73865.1 Serine/threonine protein kinase [Mucilaginibacter lappiensis]